MIELVIATCLVTGECTRIGLTYVADAVSAAPASCTQRSPIGLRQQAADSSRFPPATKGIPSGLVRTRLFGMGIGWTSTAEAVAPGPSLACLPGGRVEPVAFAANDRASGFRRTRQIQCRQPDGSPPAPAWRAVAPVHRRHTPSSRKLGKRPPKIGRPYRCAQVEPRIE